MLLFFHEAFPNFNTVAGQNDSDFINLRIVLSRPSTLHLVILSFARFSSSASYRDSGCDGEAMLGSLHPCWKDYQVIGKSNARSRSLVALRVSSMTPPATQPTVSTRIQTLRYYILLSLSISLGCVWRSPSEDWFQPAGSCLAIKSITFVNLEYEFNSRRGGLRIY